MVSEEFEWYLDFVDKSYKPKPSDLIAVFRVKPAEGISLEEAAGRVASESSIGTWTTLTTMTEDLRALMARAYEIRSDGIVRIAYPLDLFELGNLPQLLSSVAGNVFGMRAIKALRLEDIVFPKEYIESFKGPQFGIKGVRDKLKVYGRPITATVVKPKVGLDTERYAKAAYEILAGGVDLLKDDENLTSQNFNKFEKRLAAVMKVIDKVEKETGERKGYLVNITADCKEMIRRAKLVADYGNEFIMVDILVAGWAATQTIREVAEDYKLAIHAHRAFHAAFTRNKEHGMSMFVVAKLARLVGVDHIHIGTPGLGKMEAKTKEVLTIQRVITSEEFKPDPDDNVRMPQKWYGLKPVFPVASGGLHPGVLPQLIKIMGVDVIVQVGGGVTGHPDGPYAGAKAVRQAIDAAIKGIPLEEYAKEHKELARALEKWGTVVPK